MIPAYLIIVGGVGVIRNIFGIQIICSRRAETANENPLNQRNEFMILLDAVLASWLIIGTIWTIYVGIYRSDEPDSEYYCHKTLFMYFCFVTE